MRADEATYLHFGRVVNDWGELITKQVRHARINPHNKRDPRRLMVNTEQVEEL